MLGFALRGSGYHVAVIARRGEMSNIAMSAWPRAKVCFNGGYVENEITSEVARKCVHENEESSKLGRPRWRARRRRAAANVVNERH